MHSYPQTHMKAALLLAAFLAIVITALPAQQSDSLPGAPVSLELEVPGAPDLWQRKRTARQTGTNGGQHQSLGQSDDQAGR